MPDQSWTRYTFEHERFLRGPPEDGICESSSAGSLQILAFAAVSTDQQIPFERLERFNEVAALIDQFGQQHLDAELTEFAMRLWRRLCRQDSLDCQRGKGAVWAASVIHVIARMNFLFDRQQPVHLTFDTICGSFQTNKTTIGSKATEIERRLQLQLHCEPGLCRSEFMESFTMVRMSNGMVLPWKMAKAMGYLPPDAKLENGCE